MGDILDVEVLLSNFDGRDRVSLREFIGYASMEIEEDAYHEGQKYEIYLNQLTREALTTE